MFYIELFFIAACVTLTIVGYRKHNRNYMLLGTLCLVVATVLPSVANGFQESYEQRKQELKAENR
ncbi:hypothetical protein [Pseudidiomarina sediminum]|uniref:hypothetical protein n=1 Tax=Pseudidiomarina sediminum TaxID=431675 RepID=UPI001C950D47|nr:hypothetical protein [Pseudidiomarina sediminum]MBY6063327.1 hypothetical protein [Pseudidiomarina sediminum]